MSAKAAAVAALFDSVQRSARLYVERRAKLRAFFDVVEKSLNECGVAISMNVAIRIEDDPSGSYWALAWRRVEKSELCRWGLFVERWQPNVDGEDAMKERVPVQSARRDLRIFAAMRFDKFLDVLNEKIEKELDDMGAAIATVEGLLGEFVMLAKASEDA